MISRRFWTFMTFVFLLAVLPGRLLCAGFPDRPLTNIVVWGAMGGTDVCNRVISKAMAEELKAEIDVVNMIGGVSGSWGMRYVMDLPHDGYTLCGISEACAASAALGGEAPPMRDWEIFVVATAPVMLSVGKDSPFHSQRELYDAVRRGEKLTIAAGGRGTVHHLNLLLLERALGMSLEYRDFPGSAASMKAAEEGEVDAVIASIPEQARLIRAGKLRPLGVFADRWLEFDEMLVPAVWSDCLGMEVPFYTWLAVAVPGDTPKARLDILRSAFQSAMVSLPVRLWARESGYGLLGMSGIMATKLFAAIETRSINVLFRTRPGGRDFRRKRATDGGG